LIIEAFRGISPVPVASVGNAPAANGFRISEQQLRITLRWHASP
jgi:hypothetical protein